MNNCGQTLQLAKPCDIHDDCVIQKMSGKSLVNTTCKSVSLFTHFPIKFNQRPRFMAPGLLYISGRHLNNIENVYILYRSSVRWFASCHFEVR